MGITGLLPLVKKASTNTHVRKFSGCTVGIDAYVWLHKGAFGCAEKLGKGEPTTAYVTYCIKYINVLLSHNIKPIVVLDGRNLPSKAETEKKRREKREENRKNAKEFLRKGMKKEAWECFTRCVDVTPAMARELIKVLRGMKIDYIIAPYEADAQLAYLAKKKIIDIVITEDSDLILFGCPKIFFKMNPEGHGVLFDESKLHSAMGLKAESFIFERFRRMCILSGCDYLASLPGIGLGRAKKLVDSTTSNDIRKILMGVSTTLRLDIEVPEDYVQGFQQAENTFLYQLVFDPTTRKLLPLTPYPEDINVEDIPYAGSYKQEELALGMALGNIDIHTLKVVDNFDPMNANSGYDATSMWHRNYDVKAHRAHSANPSLTNKDLSKAFCMERQTLSVKNVVRKRALQDEACEEEGTDSNETMLSFYKTAQNDTDDQVSTDFFESNQQTVKRIKIDEDTHTETKSSSTDIVHETSKSRNPFLKFKCSKTVSETRKTQVTENENNSKRNQEINQEYITSVPSQDVSSKAVVQNDVTSRILHEKSSVTSEEKVDCSDSDDDGTSKFFRSTRLSQSSLKENSSVCLSPVVNRQTKSDISSLPDARSSTSLNPVCLVEKNRLYEDNSRVTVKSQYFKNSDFTSSKNSHFDSESESTSQNQKDNFTLSIYSLSKNDVDSGISEETLLTKTDNDDEDTEDSQPDLADEDEILVSESRNSRPVLEITLDDDEPLHKPAISKTMDRNLTRPLRKPSVNHRSKKNQDPKQPSLKTLFARQEKKKI